MKAIDRLILVAVAIGLFGVASTLSARGSGEDPAKKDVRFPIIKSDPSFGFDLRRVGYFKTVDIGEGLRAYDGAIDIYVLRELATGHEWVSASGMTFVDAGFKNPPAK